MYIELLDPVFWQNAGLVRQFRDRTQYLLIEQTVFAVKHVARHVELAWHRDQPLVAELVQLLHMYHALERLFVAHDKSVRHPWVPHLHVHLKAPQNVLIIFVRRRVAL